MGNTNVKEKDKMKSIIAKNVSLFRKKKQILKDVNFDVNKGEIVSILGPNGSGKTTLIRSLTTALKPNSGEVKIFGDDIPGNELKIKRIIGITPQENNLYESLTAQDNLIHHGRLFGMTKKEINQRIDVVLKQVDLLDRKKDQVKKFSGGMKRRLAVARSIMHEPRILFLDEPTTGLDPKARHDIWLMLKDLREKTDVTILLTSHYMEEAEVLSDRVVVINEGTVVEQDSSENLRRREIGEAIIELIGVPESQRNIVEIQFPNSRYFEAKELIQIPLEDFNDIPIAMNTIKDHQIDYENIVTRETTLEDVFFKLTGTILQ